MEVRGKSRTGTRPRWSCDRVKRVRVPVDLNEWNHILEIIAKELYQWSHQLQDQETETSISCDHRSHSLIQTAITLKPIAPARLSAGHEGEDDGIKDLRLAS